MTDRTPLVIVNGQVQQLQAGDSLAGVTGGGAGGITTVNFGAFPGGVSASVVVADTGATSGAAVIAELAAVATADHTIDEHIISTISFRAIAVTAGVGFTLYAQAMDGLTYGSWSVAWIRR